MASSDSSDSIESMGQLPRRAGQPLLCGVKPGPAYELAPRFIYRRVLSNFQATMMVLKTVTAAEKIAIVLFDIKLQGRGLNAGLGLQYFCLSQVNRKHSG